METGTTASLPSYTQAVSDAADDLLQPVILVLDGQSIHAESDPTVPLYQVNRSIANLGPATSAHLQSASPAAAAPCAVRPARRVLYPGHRGARSPPRPPRTQAGPRSGALDSAAGRHEGLGRDGPAAVRGGCSAGIRGSPSTGSMQVDRRRRPRCGDGVRLGPGAPTTGHGFAPARDAGCAGGSVVLSRVAAVGGPATVADCADQPSRAYIAYWMEEVSMM
ncbi:hypothetical protein V500_05905 [Pseudogymnoascus sp. VKM F-4518 (FW-2643)]|nr:hypothetical protein V500_05905 [Pseudogymnoascus sp. VKM F-4518 (FW-2643)]